VTTNFQRPARGEIANASSPCVRVVAPVFGSTYCDDAEPSSVPFGSISQPIASVPALSGHDSETLSDFALCGTSNWNVSGLANELTAVAAAQRAVERAAVRVGRHERAQDDGHDGRVAGAVGDDDVVRGVAGCRWHRRPEVELLRLARAVPLNEPSRRNTTAFHVPPTGLRTSTCP